MRVRKRRLSKGEPLSAFDNGFRLHLSTGNCHRPGFVPWLLTQECLSVRAPGVPE